MALVDAGYSGPSSFRLSLVGAVLRGLLAICSLGSVVLLARELGPAGRGEFFLFVAAVGVLTRLADLGASPSAVVFVGRYPFASGTIYRALLRRMALVWVGVAFVFVGAFLVLGERLDELMPRAYAALMVVVLPLTLYEQLWIYVMVGARRVSTMNVVQAAGGLLTLLLNIVLVVSLGGGVPAAVAVFVAVMVARVSTMALLAPRGGSLAAEGVPRLEREMLWFGLRSYPGSLASLLWTRIPAFVLAITHGTWAVGIFSVGQQVQEQLHIPAQATQDAIYQRVTNRPRAFATEAMDRYLRVAVWGMLPVVLLCAISAPWVVPIVFGPEFATSTLVLQVLLFGTALTTIPALLSPYFFGQLHKPGLMSLTAWSRVLIALALTLVLAPAFAELGVALALVVADVSVTFILLLLYVHFAPTTLRRAVVPRVEDLTQVLGRAQAALRGRA